MVIGGLKLHQFKLHAKGVDVLFNQAAGTNYFYRVKQKN